MEESINALEAGSNGGAKSLRTEEATFPSDTDRVPEEELEECFKSNGLQKVHIAALKGETALFRNISKLLDSDDHQLSSLRYLTEALDSQGRSPLHLASAYGHVGTVEWLLKANSKMCLAYDRDGLNPLHAAAIAGKVEVLDVLLIANPCAARARVDKRETILHLCVRHNQFEFLNRLLDHDHFKGDKEFLNAKDHDGNTLLHLAVSNRRVEIIGLVLNYTGIDVNATNASKQTAMDILLLAKCEETKPLTHESDGTKPQNMENIEDLLGKYEGKSGSDLDLSNTEFIERKRKWLTIVAILMATIAFQAGVNPPGGVWLDTSDGHRAGQSVMAYTNPHSYSNFICCNTIGFVASLLTITFLISGAYKKQISVGLLVVVMFISITSTAFTYAYAIIVFTPKMEREVVDYTVAVAVIIWFGMQAMFVVLYGRGWMKKMWSTYRVYLRIKGTNSVGSASHNEHNV